ncbi:MAG: LysM peptidoglycan-binding domain-containing protein [Phycisphaerae bacterium]|nr:LysM peptidoglycan-binding domain-containing protein [Phycisphaerae bacterium]
MARIRSIRMRSWPLMVGIGLVAVVVWGLYVSLLAPHPASRPRDTTAVSMADGASSSETTPAEKATPLRATRPISETGHQVSASSGWSSGQHTLPGGGTDSPGVSMDPAGLSSRVTANAPPASLRETEITISDAPPPEERPAPPALENGRAALSRGDLVAARNSFSAVFAHGLDAPDAALARAEAERIADALLFSRATTPDDPLTGSHVVGSGETLSGIARRYKITEDLLASINLIADPDRIRVGTRLKVIHGPFRAVISKSSHRMDIYIGDVLVRSFRVGLGTNGGTPTGTWTVADKLRNPEWTDPLTGRHYLADDQDNPIGERWIGLHGVAGECVGRVGFGIHGTIDPASIGENMSMGCIRLVPDDISLVYDLLVSEHSCVLIE